MVASLALRVMKDLGDKTEMWFTDAAKELVNQVTWDEDGGHTTEDDAFLDGICQENFRAIENVDASSRMDVDLVSKTSSMTGRKRADDRSVNAFGTAAGFREKLKNAIEDDDSSDDSRDHNNATEAAKGAGQESGDANV